MTRGLRVVLAFVREALLRPTLDSVVDLETGQVIARGKFQSGFPGHVESVGAADGPKPGGF